MRILVTGGAGYIGSHLVDRLLEDSHHVFVIDNLLTGKEENIDHHVGSDRFTFVNEDILDRDTMEWLIQQVDLVYHLAAVVGVQHIINNPLQGIITNVRGTELVLELAYKYWRKVVIASSSEVYGKSERVPLAENDDSILGPTAVGRWSYALSKAIDEHMAFIYHSRGLPAVVVRYFNSFGPRMDPLGYGSAVARFIRQAFEGVPLTVYDDGRQTRCFTFIDDTVEGTVLAANLPDAEGLAFNIGSSHRTPIVDLARLIIRLSGSTSEIRHISFEEAFGPGFEETRQRVPNTTRAAKVLGFEARTSLEEGLRQTIDWFRQHPSQRLLGAEELRIPN